ncbi:MAG: hypothetical protein OEU80_05615, partial [Deltaproteobacteria bacterium]|nr:hypothetical protein [Deltaproteobacteria bacterium]
PVSSKIGLFCEGRTLYIHGTGGCLETQKIPSSPRRRLYEPEAAKGGESSCRAGKIAAESRSHSASCSG